MVFTHSKSFIFSVFFSLNLLVSGLKASDYGRDAAKLVVPYIAAAVVAKVAENRLGGNGSICPVGWINEVVPVKTHITAQEVRLLLMPVGFPERNDEQTNKAYQEVVMNWGCNNGYKVFFSETGLVDYILKQEEVAVVDATVRRLGVQVGNIPVNVVSIPECKQLEKRPWTRKLIQALNTDFFLPGANPRNIFEIAAVLKVATIAYPYLPAVPSFSKK